MLVLEDVVHETCPPYVQVTSHSGEQPPNNQSDYSNTNQITVIHYNQSDYSNTNQITVIHYNQSDYSNTLTTNQITVLHYNQSDYSITLQPIRLQYYTTTNQITVLH